MPPHFSIIIPFYNGMPYLKACMESVLHQSYTHFEVLLLDSGSTDGSLEYVQQLKDERIKIITTPKRLSITENWNQILTLPLAPYATILGQDDVFDADFLNIIHGLIIHSPDAGLYTAPFRFIDQHGQIIRQGKPMKPRFDVKELLQDMLSLSIDITATGYVFRSDLYKQVGGIPIFSNLMYSDYALWLAITEKSYLAVAERECFSFRIHSNTSQTTSGLIYLNSLESFSHFLKEMVGRQPELNMVIKQHFPGYVTHYGQMIAHRVLGARDAERKGETVKSVVEELNAIIESLGAKSNPGVRSNRSIGLAEWIDALPPLRWLFRKWKAAKM